jgi:hypothetical protein
MDELRQSALEWIAKARRDMEAAKRMIDCADPLLDTGAYHCQKSGRKSPERLAHFSRDRRAQNTRLGSLDPGVRQNGVQLLGIDRDGGFFVTVRRGFSISRGFVRAA